MFYLAAEMVGVDIAREVIEATEGETEATEGETAAMEAEIAEDAEEIVGIIAEVNTKEKRTIKNNIWNQFETS